MVITKDNHIEGFSVNNKRDRLLFTQLFVPQASQSSYDRRAELDVRLAIPSAQSACGMEDFMTIELINNEQVFNALLPELETISDEDAECTIRTIEIFYQVMCERRNDLDK